MKKEKKVKKNKSKKENPSAAQRAPHAGESFEQLRRTLALGRRRSDREQEKLTAEQERLRVFLRRIKAASGKKAELTVRTKSYYRFAREYPANVDTAGFRENAPPAKKPRRAVLIALCAALAFCLAFVLAKTGILLSGEAPADAGVTQEAPAEAAALGYYHFSYDEFTDGDTDAMLETLHANGCGAALFEIKSESGYVNLSAPELALAGRRTADPEETVAALQQAGIKTCAYISCFRDPLAAQWEPGIAVARTGGGVWTDNDNAGWLNPFSDAARAYLTRIIAAAAKAGFDSVLLDHVCFSADSGTAMAFYPAEESSGLSRSGALYTFVEEAVEAAAGARVIVMCRYPAFDPLAAPELPGYGGNLLQTAAWGLCADARLSRQPKNCSVGTAHFADPAAMPFVFTLAVCDYAEGGVADSLSGAEVLVCVENDGAGSETLEAVRLSGVSGYVLW